MFVDGVQLSMTACQQVKTMRIHTLHKRNSPSTQEITTLVELFTAGRYTEAAALAQKITVRYPQDGFGWKVLGALFKRMGREENALVPMQKAAALLPHDAEAHNNLGITLMEMGRPEEALSSYRRAVEINPDFAEAHNNFGNALKSLYRPEKAEHCYRKALEIRPDYAEAHSNLGNTLHELGRLGEAEVSCRRALEIKPDYARAHNNLGNALRDNGRLQEAETSYRQALKLKPDYAEALLNLGHILCDLDNLRQAANAYQSSYDFDPANSGLEAAVYSAILCYLYGNFEQCRSWLIASQTILTNRAPKYKNSRAYWCYLDKLLVGYQQSNQANHLVPSMEVLYVIGESHALSTHGVLVRHNNQEMRIAAEWISGCKQWHLGNSKPNRFKHKFEAVMARLPQQSNILLTIGEIDCRADEGIIRAWKKMSDRSLEDIAQTTVSAYVKYVNDIAARHDHQLIIGGVPATNIKMAAMSEDEKLKFVRLIRSFNTILKEQAMSAGLSFLDVYSLTDRGDGIASGEWHIDDVHLLPNAVVEAFAKHCIQPPITTNFMRE